MTADALLPLPVSPVIRKWRAISSAFMLCCLPSSADHPGILNFGWSQVNGNGNDAFMGPPLGDGVYQPKLQRLPCRDPAFLTKQQAEFFSFGSPLLLVL